MELRQVSEVARWVGAATSVVCGLPVILGFARTPDGWSEPRHLLWMALFVVFLAAFWRHSPAEKHCQPRIALTELAVMSIAALGMVWAVPYTLLGVLLVIVAAGLGEFATLAVAVTWICVQTGIFTAWMLPQFSLGDSLVIGGSFLGFQLFALYAAHTAVRERQAREELGRTNAELIATRRLLEETSRAAERLRIARDLHDVVGHHLTALSLHLEAARHARPEASRESVETAHGITRELLAEVRRVVGAMRDEQAIDLRAALGALSQGIDRPRIHVALPRGFRGIDDPERAQALHRCAQEMVTNALRHAEAENLWLELVDGPDGLELTARDDGRGAREDPAVDLPAASSALAPVDRAAGSALPTGAPPATGGLGLPGMVERLERLGGRLTVDAKPGAGFRVTAWLPPAGGAR